MSALFYAILEITNPNLHIIIWIDTQHGFVIISKVIILHALLENRW